MYLRVKPPSAYSSACALFGWSLRVYDIDLLLPLMEVDVTLLYSPWLISSHLRQPPPLLRRMKFILHFLPLFFSSHLFYRIVRHPSVCNFSSFTNPLGSSVNYFHFGHLFRFSSNACIAGSVTGPIGARACTRK